MSGTVLVIGGSDSSGGAGVTRDVATLSAFGVPAAVVVTAVTAQTDEHVSAIHHVPPEIISEQIATALAARRIAAIKIGMLGCVAALRAVTRALQVVRCPVVLDPVLIASSGRMLLEASALDTLRAELLPRAALITPNVPEAATLLGTPSAVNELAMLEQARALLELGAQGVLLKGGHGSGTEAVDFLTTAAGTERLVAARLQATLRGTGCMLASAVAAGLAVDRPLLEACVQAKRYVTERLQEGSQRR